MNRRRDLALLAGRAILGGYLAAHGAQKLFGTFDGPGIKTTAAAFEHIGLRPGRLMATTASVSEICGGLLTASGLAHPLGPVALVGTMAVAGTTHRDNGPFAAERGFELPLTNLALALVLAAAGGAGRYSLDTLLGTALPRRLGRATVVGAGAASAAAIAMLLRAKPEPPVTGGTEPGAPPAGPKES